MATCKQVVEILDDAFNLAGTGRLYADNLRAAGLLPSTQGKPAQIASEHVTLLLLAVLLGEPASQDTPARVQAYAALRPGDGPTLGEILAAYVDSPHNLFELRLELGAPAATITFRGTDRGMAVIVLADDTARHSGVERYAILDGNLMTRISAAIANAPVVKTGRRRRHNPRKSQ